jgi:hypothetical protein
MKEEQKRLLSEIVDRIIFHGHDYYPGFKSEFICTFSNDEFVELKRIQEELRRSYVGKNYFINLL